jgi:hypothetical protein
MAPADSAVRCRSPSAGPAPRALAAPAPGSRPAFPTAAHPRPRWRPAPRSQTPSRARSHETTPARRETNAREGRRGQAQARTAASYAGRGMWARAGIARGRGAVSGVRGCRPDLEARRRGRGGAAVGAVAVRGRGAVGTVAVRAVAVRAVAGRLRRVHHRHRGAAAAGDGTTVSLPASDSSRATPAIRASAHAVSSPCAQCPIGTDWYTRYEHRERYRVEHKLAAAQHTWTSS